MNRKELASWRRQKVAELYPLYSASEVEAMTGINKITVAKIVLRNGFSHTPETLKRLAKKRVEAMGTPEAKRRSAISIRKAYARERRRLLSGLRQETRYRVSLLPLRVRNRKYELCRNYGYFSDGNPNSTTLYYDHETRRNVNAERYASEHYGIQFREGAE